MFEDREAREVPSRIAGCSKSIIDDIQRSNRRIEHTMECSRHQEARESGVIPELTFKAGHAHFLT